MHTIFPMHWDIWISIGNTISSSVVQLKAYLKMYSVFKKEGVKAEGYYLAKKWILGAV